MIANLLGVLVFMLTLFFVLAVVPFFLFKRREKNIKKLVYKYIHSGESLRGALRILTIDILPKETKINLGSSTFAEIVADEMQKLQKKMDDENIFEIYSQFIDLYIYKNRHNLTNEDTIKLQKAVRNMQLKEKDGYYVLKYSPISGL